MLRFLTSYENEVEVQLYLRADFSVEISVRLIAVWERRLLGRDCINIEKNGSVITEKFLFKKLNIWKLWESHTIKCQTGLLCWGVMTCD